MSTPKSFYLAGPMRGKPNFNFPLFDAAAKWLRAQGFTVFSPAERDRQDGFNPENNPEWSKGSNQPHSIAHYMAIDLPEVCKADAIAVLEDWENSQGCNIEVAVGAEVGKSVYSLIPLRPMYSDVYTTEFTLVERTSDLSLIKRAPKQVKIRNLYTQPVGLQIDYDSPKTAEALKALQADLPPLQRTIVTGQTAGVGEDLPASLPPIDTTNPKDILGMKKPAFHLIPQTALVFLAKVMMLGAKKYGPYNWRDKKVRLTVYLSAAMRHLAQCLDGEWTDPESGAPHLAHAMACCAIVLDAYVCDCLIDDRPKPGRTSALLAQFTEKS